MADLDKSGTGLVRIRMYAGPSLGWVETSYINGLPPGSGAFSLIASDGVSQAEIDATTYGVNGGGIFHGRMARGTVDNPIALQAGDIVGGYGVRAFHSGGAFQVSSPASIHGVASENQSPTNFGMYWRFLTTPKGTNIRQERVIIADNGTLWAHDTATYDPTLDAQTQPLGSAPNTLILASGAGNSSIAAVAYGNSATGGGFRGLQANNTPASPQASPSGVILAFVGGHGHDGSIFTASSKALISLKAAETFSPTNQGTTIGFECTQLTTTIRTEVARLDKPTTAAQTALQLWDVNAAALARVTVGANDSGGAGFKVLRIPN